jgi:fibronectin-binding autotransporter adhesin
MLFPRFRLVIPAPIDKPLQGKARQRFRNRKRAFAALVVAATVVDYTSPSHAATQTSTWAGATSTAWSNSANWNPSNTDPNNGNASISDFDVVINSVTTPDFAPSLDTTVTIDSMTLNTGATLGILGNTNMTITGNTVNKGVITINSDVSYSSSLTLGGTVSGSGTITLNSGSSNAVLAGTFTQSSGDTIDGTGEITATLTNNALVNATSSGNSLYVDGTTVINTATMEATTGPLVFNNNVAVNNAGGLIDAVGNTVTLNNASITGGTLSATSPNAILVQNATLSGSTISTNTTVDVTGNSNLTLTGSTLTDNGNIQLNYNVAYSSTLQVNSDLLLTGSGSVTLDSSGSNAVIATGTSDILTQDVNHTINGTGEITADFVNNGTVDANSASGLTLLTSNMTNNKVMEATSGGLLTIGAITLTNTSGTITANNATVDLSSPTITGGTLKSSNAGTFQTTSGTTTTLAGVTNDATFNVVGNSNVTVTGNLVNNGVITLNNNQSYGSTLNFGGGTVSGTGTIALDSTSANALIAGTLTQSSGHTINGYGEITATLTNNGLVNANVSISSTAQTLDVGGSALTNTSTMEATSGALIFNGGVSVNNAGGLIDAVGNNVTFDSASITGGTLSATSPNVILVEQNATLSGPTISPNTTVDVYGNTDLTLTGTTLTDNGNIVLNYNQFYSATLQVNSDLLLTGSGSVTLDSSGSNAVIATGTSDILTQDVNHTINGTGEITADFVNNGTVDANSASGLTLLTSNMTNNKVMEATSGGLLTIGAITLTNTSGTITANNATVDLSSPTITGGTLKSSNAGTFQTTSGTTTTLAGVTNDATFNVVGNSNVTVTGNLVNNGTINVNYNQYYSTTLTANGAISGTGALNIPSNSLLTLAANVGANSQGSLSITGSGQLNLNNNHFFINYGSGPDPIASIAAWIVSGYAGGAWNGAGIESSAAHSNSSYGIGYADSADPGNPAGLASHQIEIMYTLLGDANLDSKVNGADFTLMAANFNDSVTDGWDKGDFNYDGKVNGSDFVLLANNFNQFASQSAVSAADLTALNDFAAANGISLANVPEPASGGMIVMAGFGILRRRRRS